MKAIILTALMLTGCASVSDYNQGCRDGINGLEGAPGLSVDEKKTDKYCNDLENEHKLKKEIKEGKRL
jgi:hypothetical protein